MGTISLAYPTLVQLRESAEKRLAAREAPAANQLINMMHNFRRNEKYTLHPREDFFTTNGGATARRCCCSAGEVVLHGICYVKVKLNTKLYEKNTSFNKSLKYCI